MVVYVKEARNGGQIGHHKLKNYYIICSARADADVDLPAMRGGVTNQIPDMMMQLAPAQLPVPATL